MLAIVEIGSKQYMVKENDIIYVEKLFAKENENVKFDKVLWYADQIGKPYLKDVTLVCKVLKHDKQKKILVIKHKRYNRMLKRYGHKQPYTKLMVLSVETNKDKPKVQNQTVVLKTETKPKLSEKQNPSDNKSTTTKKTPQKSETK